MTIASEITRISNAKSALKTAINNKGGTLTSETLSSYAAAVDALATGGGSADIYKCASVDTSAKTWTGYKAVLTSGIYSFSSSVTTGLQFTVELPVVGNIYTYDALVKVSHVYTGGPDSNTMLLLHLDDDVIDATGHSTVTNEGCTFVSFGKFGSALQCNSSYGLTAPYSSYFNLAGFTDWTVDCWVCLDSWPGSGNIMILNTRVGNTTSGMGYWFGIYDDNGLPFVYNGSTIATSTVAVALTTWTHLAFVSVNGVLTFYVNGVSGGSVSYRVNSTSLRLAIGYVNNGQIEYLPGKLDELRISNCARWTSTFTPPTSPY